MAREHQERSADSKTSENETYRDNRQINRRRYLQLAGITAAGVGTVAASGTAGASSQYEVIEARGQVIRVGDNETFENKLIDMGDGNDIRIVATGTDWTIRNVGFVGTFDHDGALFGVADSGGGHSIIENVYFGDGDPNASASERGQMIWISPDHSGHMDIRCCNFNVEGTSGVYGSAPSRNSGGNGGSIHIDSCYAVDNHHTAYRVCGGDDVISNSVAVMRPGAYSNRGIWIEDGSQNGEVDIENVDIITENGGSSLIVRSGASARVKNFSYTSGTLSINGDVDWGARSTNPTEYVPEGCPTSAEEAASGDGSETGHNGGDDEDIELPSTQLEVIGTGEPCRYTFTVEGDLEEDPHVGEIDEWTEIDGSTATGWVTVPERTDGYRFDGDILEFEFIEGSARVELDGETIEPDELSKPSEKLPPNRLEVIGTGEPCRYTIEFSEELVADPDVGEIDEWTEIDGSTATGWVTVPERTDGYRFSGEILDIQFHEGSARIELDGETIDPDKHSSSLTPENRRLEVIGTGEPCRYTFTVEGDLEEDPDVGKIDEWTEIDGSTAIGWVTVPERTDGYRFDGNILEFEFIEGSARVELDGELIDVDGYNEL